VAASDAEAVHAGALTLRPLAPGDRASWTPLWQAYLAFYETSLPPEVYDSTFARYTDPARTDMFAFVAEDGTGHLLGLVHCIVHAHGWKTRNIVYLQDLFTIPEARGRGIARALIERVYAETDARGLEGPYWLTQEFNTTARAVYDRVAQVTPFIKYQRG